MGNQESIINDKYELKKKVLNKDVNTDNTMNLSKKNIDKELFSEVSTKGKTKIINKDMYNNSKTINKNTQYKQNNINKNVQNNINKNVQYKQNINNTYINKTEYDNIKKLNKDENNNALISRNMLSDIYQNKTKNNFIFDYPSNSNNELDIPKKSFDNLKFTPYNFNDEVSQYSSGGWFPVSFDKPELFFDKKGELKGKFKYYDKIPNYFNDLNNSLYNFIISDKIPSKEDKW